MMAHLPACLGGICLLPHLRTPRTPIGRAQQALYFYDVQVEPHTLEGRRRNNIRLPGFAIRGATRVLYDGVQRLVEYD